MLEKVFGMQYVLKSPEIELFGHFKVIWHLLDKSSFSTAVDDENMASIITPWKDSVTEFAIDQLEKRQVRDDYRELLELSVVFLGGTPPRGIRFQYPGAIHRARWMARAIYSVKMWLFHKQYEPLQLGSKRLQKSCGPSHRKQMRKHLNEVCLFVTGMYIKYWFQSPLSAAAPRNDLNLLCTLSAYPNRKVAEAATTAFGRHLWYLPELLIRFAFFDDDVSIEEKRLMVMALIDTEGSDEPPKRISLFVSPEM